MALKHNLVLKQLHINGYLFGSCVPIYPICQKLQCSFLPTYTNSITFNCFKFPSKFFNHLSFSNCCAHLCNFLPNLCESLFLPNSPLISLAGYGDHMNNDALKILNKLKKSKKQNKCPHIQLSLLTTWPIIIWNQNS